MSRRVPYHRAEVLESIGGPRRYLAACRCGWRGRDQASRRAADDDATAHEIAHNAGSPPRDADEEDEG